MPFDPGVLLIKRRGFGVWALGTWARNKDLDWFIYFGLGRNNIRVQLVCRLAQGPILYKADF